MLGTTWPLLIGFAAAAIAMALLWAHARARQHFAIVDVGWALLVGSLGIFYASVCEGDPSRRMLVGMMILLWSLRLSGHLFFNRVLGQPEDRRYVAMREHWGERAYRKFFWFFQAQAGLALLFSLPIWAIAQMPAPLRAIDYAGVALWWLSVTCESLADRQLARFRADPVNRGRACRVGLWRYSRHPNYFFEFVHWCSYALVGWGSAYWWICAAAPWLMLWFLLRLTGVRPTEANAAKSRGEDYARYQRTTSSFIPWPPRKDRE